MKKKILIAAAVIISSTTHAQDSTKLLSEVIITPGKMEQKQNQTGKVVTLITKAQLEKSNGKSITQLLNEQAGITISGALNNAGGNQTVFLRGASSGRTLILLDGIPVYDPSMLTNDFDFNLLALDNVERIEICKGAQSTLYGSDAVAGVINIITIKKDISKPLNINASVAAGSFSLYKSNFQAYGRRKKFSYSGGYSKLYLNGYSSAYDSSRGKNFEKDGYNGDMANAMLKYDVTDNFSAKSFVRISRYKTDIDASAFTDEKDYTSNNKSIIAGAGILYKSGGVNLTANYQYSDFTRNFINDSAYIDPLAFSNYQKYDNYGKSQFVEIFSSIKLCEHFTFLQGADYRFNNMNNQFLSVSSYPPPYTSNFKDTFSSQASLYASLFFHPVNNKSNSSSCWEKLEGLNVELGGRLNVHSAFGNNASYTFNPSYSIRKDLRVFGSIATAYKTPSLYQLYDVYNGNKDLMPEEAINYEAGVQHQYKKIINSRLVYFYRDIKKGIDYNYLTDKYFNIGRQIVRGIELEVQAFPTEDLSINANYAYLSPIENSQSRSSFADTSYKYLLKRPAHNINISAGYSFTRLFISLSMKYVSKRYDVGGYGAADILLNSYAIFNAYAQYKVDKRVKVFFDIKNITDSKFFDVRGFNSMPFNFIGGINFQL